MTIEKDLSRIATALETIVARMGNVTPAAPAPVVAAAPVAPVVAPVVETPTPVVAAPAAPAAPVVAGAPFNDAKGMIQYMMDSFKALGPTKGMGIQTVLTTLGYTNVNEVKPESYAALFAGVEALK